MNEIIPDARFVPLCLDNSGDAQKGYGGAGISYSIDSSEKVGHELPVSVENPNANEALIRIDLSSHPFNAEEIEFHFLGDLPISPHKFVPFVGPYGIGLDINPNLTWNHGVPFLFSISDNYSLWKTDRLERLQKVLADSLSFGQGYKLAWEEGKLGARKNAFLYNGPRDWGCVAGAVKVYNMMNAGPGRAYTDINGRRFYHDEVEYTSSLSHYGAFQFAVREPNVSLGEHFNWDFERRLFQSVLPELKKRGSTGAVFIPKVGKMIFNGKVQPPSLQTFDSFVGHFTARLSDDSFLQSPRGGVLIAAEDLPVYRGELGGEVHPLMTFDFIENDGQLSVKVN